MRLGERIGLAIIGAWFAWAGLEMGRSVARAIDSEPPRVFLSLAPEEVWIGGLVWMAVFSTGIFALGAALLVIGFLSGRKA